MNISIFKNKSHNLGLSTEALVAVSLVYYTGMLLAIVGNGLLVITVYKRPLLQRVSYFLVCALAVEDFAASVNSALFYPPALISGEWEFGQPMCVFFGYLSSWFAGVELFLMAAISMDRYIACCRPLRYIPLVTTERCKAVIFFCWSFPFVLTLLPIIGCGSYEFKIASSVCQLEWSTRPLTVACITTMCSLSIVPCTFVMVICQFKIWRQGKRIANNPPPSLPGVAKSSSQDRQRTAYSKATLTVSLMTGTYIICWIPLGATRFSALWIDWDQTLLLQQIQSVLQRTTLHIFLVSKFANPIIYGIYNHEFRRECKQLFKRDHY